MPTLTVKTEYINKLKQLGVYDKWLANVKAGNLVYYSVKMQKATDFDDFVHVSFLWGNTPEGHEYWSGIANS